MKKSILFFVPLFVLISAASASPQTDFVRWQQQLRLDAIGQTVPEETFDKAFAGLTEPLASVLKAYNNQPEFRMTLQDYLRRVVSKERIEQGRRLAEQHAQLFQAIEGDYGIPRHVLLAFWGSESHFGKNKGSYPVIHALATLAYGSKRKTFFRRELIEALKILAEDHIAVTELQGSWAGAMGHVQFIPSTYNAYAVDYNQDNRIDIWKSTADALASAAHLLASLGWRKDETWGEDVRLPESFKTAWLGREKHKWQTVAEWEKRGVKRKTENKKKQNQKQKAAIIIPDKQTDRAFMIYHNFNVILLWNRSDYFAVAIGMLAEQIQK